MHEKMSHFLAPFWQATVFFASIISTNHGFCSTDVFVTTDIHNTACIPPSAKRPTPSSSATSASSVLQMTSGTGPVPFSPMDQIEELDVFCGGYNSASAGTAASAASTTASNSVSVEVDSLEKALGIEFHDPNVHRQLLAKWSWASVPRNFFVTSRNLAFLEQFGKLWIMLNGALFCVTRNNFCLPFYLYPTGPPVVIVLHF